MKMKKLLLLLCLIVILPILVSGQSCSTDADCPSFLECSRDAKELYRWFCNSFNQCEKTRIKVVGCCFDDQCESGQFCNSGWDCENWTHNDRYECPYECCMDMLAWFDTKVVPGHYCKDGKMVSSSVSVTVDNKPNWTLIGIVGLMGSLVILGVYFAMKKRH
jgi:hypothetical protein